MRALTWMRWTTTVGLLATGLAHAATYSFSYTRPSDNAVVAGQLDGTLQADNNTVVVNALLGLVTLNGTAGPALSFLRSTDALNFGTVGLLPKVSVNGSLMDFAACNVAGCGSGAAITFNAGNTTAASYGANGAPFDAYGGFFGAFSENFSAARWALSPVPEPATATLFCIAGAALLLSRRRGFAARRAKAA